MEHTAFGDAGLEDWGDKVMSQGMLAPSFSWKRQGMILPSSLQSEETAALPVLDLGPVMLFQTSSLLHREDINVCVLSHHVCSNRKRIPGVTVNGYGVSFSGGENIVKLDHGERCTTQ